MIKSKSTTTARIAQRKLLHAAAEVFALDGFDAATTRAIAERANSNIALIAYHFGGKEGLYDAVVGDWAGGCADAVRRDMAGVTGRRKRLEALVGAFLRYGIIEMPGVAALVVRESVFGHASPIAARTARALAPLRDLIEGELPTCATAVSDPGEFLGLMLRLTAPMPAIDGGGAVGYQRARMRALALLRPAHEETIDEHPERVAAPPMARRITPRGLDFVD